jgi:hypothetical protein
MSLQISTTVIQQAAEKRFFTDELSVEVSVRSVSMRFLFTDTW